jgi:hypothetical protein
MRSNGRRLYKLLKRRTAHHPHMHWLSLSLLAIHLIRVNAQIAGLGPSCTASLLGIQGSCVPLDENGFNPECRKRQGFFAFDQPDPCGSHIGVEALSFY